MEFLPQWDHYSLGQSAAFVDHSTASEVHGNLSGKESGLDITRWH